jgi:glycosyltransferase involved in cell wall biosynthesis
MSKTEKYLVISDFFYPEDFLINYLVFDWVKQGYNIEVLTRTPAYPFGIPFEGYKNKLYQKAIYNNVTIHRTAIIRGYNNKYIKILNYLWFAIWTSIVAICIGKKFKGILVFQAGTLTMATPAIILKKIYKQHVTLYVQDLWPDTVFAYGFKKGNVFSYLLNGFVKWVYTNCDNILISCKGFEKKIQKYTPNGHIVYAPNWSLVNNNETHNAESLLFKDKMNFTFAGNVGKVQNLDNVIMGFHLFNQNKGLAYLNIIGDGSYLKDLKNIVSENNILGVRFFGRKPIEDMPTFFSDSDVMIISLQNRPIFELTVPSKFQAYLTAKKPLFGIINGEVNDLILDNELGICSNPDSIEDIAKGFQQFIEYDKNKFNNISVNTEKLLNGEFNREKIIAKISEVFLPAI